MPSEVTTNRDTALPRSDPFGHTKSIKTLLSPPFRVQQSQQECSVQPRCSVPVLALAGLVCANQQLTFLTKIGGKQSLLNGLARLLRLPPTPVFRVGKANSGGLHAAKASHEFTCLGKSFCAVTSLSSGSEFAPSPTLNAQPQLSTVDEVHS